MRDIVATNKEPRLKLGCSSNSEFSQELMSPVFFLFRFVPMGIFCGAINSSST